jgi:NitT/TauT family transport system permease protein
MSSTVITEGLGASASTTRGGLWLGGLLASAVWIAAALVISWLPDVIEVGRTQELGLGALVLSGALLAAGLAAPLLGSVGQRLRAAGPWLTLE